MEEPRPPRPPRLFALKSFWLAMLGLVFLLWAWRDSMEMGTFAGYLSPSAGIQVAHYHSAADLRITTGPGSSRHYWERESVEMSGSDTIEDYRERSYFPAVAFTAKRDGPRVFRTWTLPYWLILPNYLALAAALVIRRHRAKCRCWRKLVSCPHPPSC